MQNIYKKFYTTLIFFLGFFVTLLKSLLFVIVFFLRIDNFFFFFINYLNKVDSILKINFFFFFKNAISQVQKSNSYWVTQLYNNILFPKSHEDNLPENFFLVLGKKPCFALNYSLSPVLKKKKSYLVSTFNNRILNDIIFELETLEFTTFEHSYDFFENTYNGFFLIDSTLYNYSLFQNRLITNEINLFDNFFFNLSFKDLKQQELLLYQYFVFFYSDLYIPSEYNLQVIHSRDSMSFFTFFSLYYYDYFKIQQEHLHLFNNIYILDDLRGFNTILQLNNNLLTDNIENYMLNLQKLIYEETHVFYSTKVNYINYKYISLFYFTLLSFNQEKSINSSSLFQQSNLMFSRNYYNIFFKTLAKSEKFFYSFFFILIFFSLLFLFFLTIPELVFSIIIISFFFLTNIFHRFLILFEVNLFGYSKKFNSKLFYEKIYLSDYKITQYDDIYYYQQQYILERDSENRKISNLLIEIENNSNFEEIFHNPNPTHFFNNNLSELLFLNFYEILYNFESDAWKDFEVEELTEAELDRIEFYHGYPFEVFISKVTENFATQRLQSAINIDDFFHLKTEIESVLDRAETPEEFYDLLSDLDLNNIENSLDDLEDFIDDHIENKNNDLELLKIYALSGKFFTVNELTKMRCQADSDLLLNFDTPDEETESIEEEFMDPEDSTITTAVNQFQVTQKVIQQKIFQTIYFELAEEKEFLIQFYKLDFLRSNKKLTYNEIVILQNLLQKGSIPFWIFNMNNFYNEVKSRVNNWYIQLYATKKIYNDFSLALLNLEQYYSDLQVTFFKEVPTTFKSYIILSLVEYIPQIALFIKSPIYDSVNEKYRQNFYSSTFAYTNIIDNDLLTSNFQEDQSLIDILETVKFSEILKSADNLPVQLDFFHHNLQIITNMLNTLNSNLYLLLCNNIHLNDFVLQNQIVIFQHYLNYTIMQYNQPQSLKMKINTLVDLFKFAKFNTIYDLEFFFYNYFFKKFKLNIFSTSPILVLNLVNYYINKYKIYSFKLPTSLNELSRFLLQLQQFEILIGSETFNSNLYIENGELSYERFYNIFFNAFDKDFLEEEEMDSFFLEEFFLNPKYQTQFYYNQIIYFESLLYVDEEIVDGDITKFPPYLFYTPFNNITIVSPLNVPTLMQEKYLYSDYIYTTLYSEIADDSFDFEGFFL